MSTAPWPCSADTINLLVVHRSRVTDVPSRRQLVVVRLRTDPERAVLGVVPAAGVPRLQVEPQLVTAAAHRQLTEQIVRCRVSSCRLCRWTRLCTAPTNGRRSRTRRRSAGPARERSWLRNNHVDNTDQQAFCYCDFFRLYFNKFHIVIPNLKTVFVYQVLFLSYDVLVLVAHQLFLPNHFFIKNKNQYNIISSVR